MHRRSLSVAVQCSRQGPSEREPRSGALDSYRPTKQCRLANVAGDARRGRRPRRGEGQRCPRTPSGPPSRQSGGRLWARPHVASETKRGDGRDAAARKHETAVDPNSVSAIGPSGAVPPSCGRRQEKIRVMNQPTATASVLVLGRDGREDQGPWKVFEAALGRDRPRGPGPGKAPQFRTRAGSAERARGQGRPRRSALGRDRPRGPGPGKAFEEVASRLLGSGLLT